MDLTKKYYLDTKKKRNKKSELASEIYEHFGRRIPYGQIASYIKNFGFQYVWEEFKNSKEAKIPPLPLFLSRFKKENCEIKWKDTHNHEISKLR